MRRSDLTPTRTTFARLPIYLLPKQTSAPRVRFQGKPQVRVRWKTTHRVHNVRVTRHGGPTTVFLLSNKINRAI